MDYVRSFDRFIAGFVAKLPDWINPIMLVASFVGSPLGATVIALVIMAVTLLLGNMQLLFGELVILILLPLGAAIKVFTRRTRPDTIYVEHMKFKTYSFPSGHSYAAVLVFGFLAHTCMRYVPDPWSWPLAGIMISIILLIGISRIYLGAHFPSDVLGGWLLGMTTLYLVLRFVITA